MLISNVNHTIPAEVRDVFLGDIPFGSDYIMYCSEYTTQRQSYECIVRYVGESMIHLHTATKQAGSDYVFNTSEYNHDVSTVTTVHPDYCYGNIRGQCRYVSVPSASDLVCLCLIVIASLTALRVVFGGIKLWSSSRRKPVF